MAQCLLSLVQNRIYEMHRRTWRMEIHMKYGVTFASRIASDKVMRVKFCKPYSIFTQPHFCRAVSTNEVVSATKLSVCPNIKTINKLMGKVADSFLLFLNMQKENVTKH